MKNLKQSIGGILICFCIFNMNSCKVTKDMKAVARVTYNSNLFDKVGRQWAVAHPCSIDTVVQFRDGKAIVRYDTLLSHEVDTVFNPVTQIKTVYKNVIKYVNKTDTLLRYISDKRAEQLAKDDLNKAQGQIVQLQSDNSSLNKQSKNRLWWLVGVSIIGLLIIAFLVYLLIRKI